MIYQKNINYIPEFKDVITESYIDEIIASEKWVEHGSHLEYFISDKQEEDESFPESLIGLDVSDVIKSSEFRDYLSSWLVRRYNYVASELKSDIEKFPLVVHRTMYLTEEEQGLVASGSKLDLGKYWGVGHTETWGVEPKKDTLATTITASISQNDIDWIETFKSRIDWLNGDYEREIQLKSTNQIIVRNLYCEEKGDISVDTHPFKILLQEHLCSFLESMSYDDINRGDCADFADSFCRSASVENLRKSGLNADIHGCYDSEDFADKDIFVGNPSWCNWKKIEYLIKKEVFGHTFLKIDGRFYDSECLHGVDCAFDLPIFERAAGEFSANLKREREQADNAACFP